MTQESMTATPTADEIRTAWNDIAPRFDRYVTPYTLPFGEQVLAPLGVRPGMRVLDVATGSGALSIPAARRGADVVAVDVAPAMIERLAARAEQEGLSTLQPEVMDGHALELDDDTFDAAVSLNGVSLFPDLPRGLREMVRVTRPGGRVLVAAFGAPHRAEFITFFLGAITAVVPDFPGIPQDPPPLPFQVADPQRLRQRLADAGLRDVGVDTITWRMEAESAGQFWETVTSSNPIGAQLAGMLTAEQTAEATHVLDGMLRERSGGRRTAVLTTDVNIGAGTA